MIHVFFIGYVLSTFIYGDLDKIGLLYFGSIGLVYRLQVNHKLHTKIDVLLLFIIYLILVSFYLMSYKALAFALLFLLQYGLTYYVYINIKKYGDKLVYKWIKLFILYQIIFVLIGLIDFFLYKNGIISPIRDYTISWKVDSLYGNPNPFGIVSGISFVILKYIKNLYKNTRYIILSILFMGVLLSGSDMALGIVILGILLEYFSLKFTYKILFVFGIFGLYYMLNKDFAFLDEIFNKRLEIWIVAFNHFQSHYIIGIGTGVFQSTVDQMDNTMGINSNYGLHSMYLWLLIECGLIGTVIYSYFVSLILRLDSMNSNTIKIFKKVFFITLLSQLTEFFIDHVEYFQLLYALIIGIIFGKYYHECAKQS
ncbi:MAG: O-antigen ligase family protein [Sulfurimonas sp.]